MQSSKLPCIPNDYEFSCVLSAKQCNGRDKLFDIAPTPCTVIVELGTRYGRWAYRAAKQNPNTHIYCVDCFTGTRRHDSGKVVMSGEHEFFEWINNTKKYRDRIHLLKKTTTDAATDFDLPIDILFIDADHTYDGLTADLKNWVPKVRTGGLIAGHDWTSKHPKVKRSVRRAVTDYFGIGNFKVDQLYWNKRGQEDLFYAFKH